MAVTFGQGWGTNAQHYALDFYRSSTAVAQDEAATGPAFNIKALGTVQDILIYIKCKASTTVGSDKVVNWFAAGSVDGGSTYSGALAADTDYSTFASNLVQYPNVIFGRPVAVQDTSQQYGGPFSLAMLFGGVLPEYCIIGIHNRTNVSLTGNNTDNDVLYQVIYTQA